MRPSLMLVFFTILQNFIGSIRGPPLTEEYFNCSAVGAGDGSDKYKLYKWICDETNPFVSPLQGAKPQPVPLTMKIELLEIVKVDVRESLLYCRLWFDMTWLNPQLAWNSSDYKLHEMVIPVDMIWSPDIKFYNWPVGKGEAASRTRASIQANGLVSWMRPMITSTFCNFKLRYFPFDTQICDIVVGQWIYDDSVVLFQNKTAIHLPEVFQPNEEWKLYYLEVGLEKRITQAKRSYSSIKFTIVLKRHPLFYSYAVIVPCVMTSVMTCLIFWIPCDSGEKLSIGVSTLTIYAIFMLLMSHTIPTNLDDAPLLVIYLTLSMCWAGLSLFMATVSMFIFHQSKFERKIPTMFKKILHTIDDWVCRINKGRHDFDTKSMTKRFNEADKDEPNKTNAALNIVKKFGEMDRFKKKLAKEKEINSEEWKICADIIDRIFCVIYTLSMIGMTTYLFIFVPIFNRKKFGKPLAGPTGKYNISYHYSNKTYTYFEKRTGLFSGKENLDLY